MMPHEYDESFGPEDNQKFADIICYGLKAVDIEFLEDFAYGIWGEDDE